MDNVFVEVIRGVFGVITALIPKWFKDRPPERIQGVEQSTDLARSPEVAALPNTIDTSGHLGKFVFSRMDLSEDARNKLARSDFIRIGGTRDALFDLVDTANKNDSMLAICGFKGDYSTAYYEENFLHCKKIRRVFSYQAMHHEIKEKNGQCYALRGLEVHLKHVKHLKEIKHTDDDDLPVQVFVLPEGKLIRDLRGDFDPPYSFGLAILIDGNDIPKKAVIHWETDAKRLKDLINIEGVIVDPTQEELLDKLVRLYQSIAHGDGVLSSSKNPDDIDNICTKLNGIWQERQSQLGKEEVKG